METETITHLEYLRFIQAVPKLIEKRSSRMEYSCIEAFVLAKGKWRKHISDQPIKRGKMKECYMNAFYLAEENNWQYIEGYAAGLIPMLHAWCLDSKKQVVDPTWNDGQWYYGVAIPMKYVYKVSLMRKR